MYDNNNIFARILRSEVPCDKIYENEYILSFYDINPQKKIHALVISKGFYIDFEDFNLRASDHEILGLIKGISKVAKILGIAGHEHKGFRLLSNVGNNGGQEVPHLHFHLFGGEKLGKMISD
jgi:histidine triad (HIT) family protein